MENSPNLTNLELEAQAFDSQIEERIANGYIPDLRLAKPCNYFYNNSWRRPEFVKLDFVEKFDLIHAALTKFLNRTPANSRILEVGCGPGYLSLELARNGFQVIGLDLSAKCIEVASSYADADPWKTERGALSYIAGDYFSSPELQVDSFDAVVFLGALHHFPDQNETLKRARRLLKPGGLILANEPVRDCVTRGNAAFAYMLQTLLSLNNNFHQRQPLVTEMQSIEREVERTFNTLRYEGENGESLQSVNDNESGYAEMWPQLSTLFQQEHFEWRSAFFHEFIGGLRFDEDTNGRVAKFMREMDRVLVSTQVLTPTEFFFVGRKT
jgi:2-polyprenyl-3-methyl-5-hydroxy-6-metoxy-1,4-benzoquinol methylase